MSRLQASTGTIKVSFVPTIADTAAPTVAEITAGTALEGFLSRDGLDTPQDGSTIDLADAGSTYNKTGAGSYGGQPVSLKCFRDDTTDTAWDTLPRETTGYLVVARFGSLAATETVEVWPITVIARAMEAIADNEAPKFTVTCAVHDDPELDAVIAA